MVTMPGGFDVDELTASIGLGMVGRECYVCIAYTRLIETCIILRASISMVRLYDVWDLSNDRGIQIDG
jgi:hypothetical protein